VIYLLDTDIFTLAHQRRYGLRERIAAVTGPDRVAVSVITRVEVLLGRLDAVKKAATAADLLRMQHRLEESESFLGTFPLIRFDQAAGAQFDQFRTDKKFKKADRGDLLIACIALANDATLVTRNTKDFTHVPGLKLDNWAA
jgi:predicted nucleic acid-binding protein